MTSISRLAMAMADFESGNTRRINHLMKVWAYAKTIGEQEGLSPEVLEILEASALTHDIGIRICLEKYGHCAGKSQEEEGPPIAEALLKKLGFGELLTERVCWLIAHHHTYNPIEGADHQILVEADFLVNMDEGQMPRDNIMATRDNIFRTAAGKALVEALFLSDSLNMEKE